MSKLIRFILITGFSFNLSAQVLLQDSLALVALYDSTNGAEWSNKTNWMTAEPVSSWHGVTITNNRVTKIELVLNNLSGIIPEAFWSLDSLENLIFQSNQLSGNIPGLISNLTNLKELHLGTNSLAGVIPNSISNLSALTSLNLSSNQLTGNIPAEISALVNLELLFLNNNQLTGTIPSGIGNLTKLVFLNLRQNQLSGSIPTEIINLKELTSLNLLSNQLTGAIPTGIDSLSNLNQLYLQNNQLSGPIPEGLWNLTQLNFLFLSNNQLSGSLPAGIGNLNPTGMDLSRNQLSGNIPAEIGNLVNLDYLYLYTNQFTGPIPTEMGNLENLTFLHLYQNQLSGPVPNQINSLTKLKFFYIYDNELSELPLLDSLVDLNNLRIQNNQFGFEDIEANIGLPNSEFIYAPQADIGRQIDTTLDVGDSLTISVFVGGSANQYQWLKDGAEIDGADSSLFALNSIDASDAGSYICRITNTIASDLTLFSRPLNLTISAVVDIADHSPQSPSAFALYQNYPNPFNPITTISYQLKTNSEVQLTIYDITGKEVETLVNQSQKEGQYSVSFDASSLASGIYIYKLTTSSGFNQSRKMVVLK